MVNDTIGGSMPLPSLLVPLLSLLGGVVGGLLGTYISKRGEIRAVHAELEKVVEQNRAITKATEEIKAQTSKTAWTRDVRKEVTFKVLESLAVVDASVTTLLSVCTGNSVFAPEDPRRQQLEAEFKSAYENYTKARMLAKVVCGDDVNDAFARIQNALMAVAASSLRGDFREIFQAFGELATEISGIGSLIRRDIGIEM
jgi:hypothetical protein